MSRRVKLAIGWTVPIRAYRVLARVNSNRSQKVSNVPGTVLNIYSNGEFIECKYTDENNKVMTDIFLRRDLCLLQAEEPSIDMEHNDYHEETQIKKNTNEANSEGARNTNDIQQPLLTIKTSEESVTDEAKAKNLFDSDHNTMKEFNENLLKEDFFRNTNDIQQPLPTIKTSEESVTDEAKAKNLFDSYHDTMKEFNENLLKEDFTKIFIGDLCNDALFRTLSLLVNLVLWIASEFVEIRSWAALVFASLCPMLWFALQRGYFMEIPEQSKSTKQLNSPKQSNYSSNESVSFRDRTFAIKIYSIVLVIILSGICWVFIGLATGDFLSNSPFFFPKNPQPSIAFYWSFLTLTLNYFMGVICLICVDFTRSSLKQFSKEILISTLSDYLAVRTPYVFISTVAWGTLNIASVLIGVFCFGMRSTVYRLQAGVCCVGILIIPTAKWEWGWNGYSYLRWLFHGLFVAFAMMVAFILLLGIPLTLFNLFQLIWALPYVFTFIFLRDKDEREPYNKIRCVYEIRLLRHLADVLVSGK